MGLIGCSSFGNQHLLGMADIPEIEIVALCTAIVESTKTGKLVKPQYCE